MVDYGVCEKQRKRRRKRREEEGEGNAAETSAAPRPPVRTEAKTRPAAASPQILPLIA